MYVVYGKPGCKYCEKAEVLLHSKNLHYVYIGLSERPEDLEWLKSLGCRSVPQIFKMDKEGITLSDEHRIGGYDDLVEHLKMS